MLFGLLFGLSLAFFFLYWFDPTILARSLKDLWANLLASVIAALLIDTIIEFAGSERRKKSRDYVKSKLYRMCTDLVSGMAPTIQPLDGWQSPWDWESAIRHEYNSKDWDWYFEHISISRAKALNQIRDIADNQQDSLEDELRGNLMVLLDSLENRDWDSWSEDKREDIWKLKYMAELAARTSENSFRLLKEHGLLAYQPAPFQEGFKRRKIDKKQLNRDLTAWKDSLNQSVRFKDAVEEKAMAYKHLTKN